MEECVGIGEDDSRVGSVPFVGVRTVGSMGGCGSLKGMVVVSFPSLFSSIDPGTDAASRRIDAPVRGGSGRWIHSVEQKWVVGSRSSGSATLLVRTRLE